MRRTVFSCGGLRASGLLPRFSLPERSSFDVQADRERPNGAPVVIVCRIVVMLRVEADEKSFHYLGAVVAFPQILGRVVQLAIADEKIKAALRQIDCMRSGNARCREGGSH